mmetsp:Transcript_22645/g.51735  ORF Transcript_22645/g.51735 Transcript_22645/m.51735 type:complete len:100 (-) Transcript_22645:74-373(-)
MALSYGRRLLLLPVLVRIIAEKAPAKVKDCDTYCTTFPTICEDIEYCIESCNVHEAQRTNCEAYRAEYNDEPGAAQGRLPGGGNGGNGGNGNQGGRGEL